MENQNMNEGSFFSLSLDHSFGYDCKRFYNLSVINGDTLLHATGRFLHFYNVETNDLRYFKIENDECIGHIATHPHLLQFAVGGKGVEPPIIIYQWPTLEKVQILKKGAKKGFSHLVYSANGELLASLSSQPYHLLVLWVWAKGEILLSAKAYEHDVHQISFSLFNGDQLASCGVNHLKFWKMSETFTGLKLLGQLCRFGKTDACNLIGAVLLPDGSCATGSTWGNILIWVDGAISLQIFRVGRLPCHTAPITQLHFHNNALMTAGMDGVIRVWNYESIEEADPSEDDPCFEMEPLFEFKIEEDEVAAEVISLVKAVNDPHDSTWYAQGGKGAVWRLDISMNVDAKPPKRIFWSHAGAVVALQTSPAVSFFATLGSDCKIIVFDYFSKQLVTFLEFPSAGTCLIWVPLSLVPSGCLLVAGFSDGVLRVLSLFNEKFEIVQAFKPHAKSICGLVVGEELLITASEDATIFLFRIGSGFQLSPIGFCELDSSPTCICWLSGVSFLVGNVNGDVLQYDFEAVHEHMEESSYRLHFEPNILKTGNADNEKIPGKILFLWKSFSNSFWCVTDDGTKSSLYKFNVDTMQIEDSVLSITQNDCSISCFCHWEIGRCILLGLSNGNILALSLDNDGKVLPDRWSYGVHDSDRGTIRQLAISWDNLRLFSCGDDCAVFSFFIKGFEQRTLETPKVTPFEKVETFMDTLEPMALSLEQARMKENADDRNRFANESKSKVLAMISQLQKEYQQILLVNETLPAEVKIQEEDLVPDQRVVDDLKQSLNEEKNLVYRKIARDSERSSKLLHKLRKYFLDGLETLVTRVDAIQGKHYVETVRITKIGDDFFQTLEEVQKIVEEMEKQGSAEDVPKPPEAVPPARPTSPDPVDALVKQVAALGDVSRNRKLASLCRQHRARRAAVAARSVVWENHMRRKPDPDRFDPKDIKAIESAKEMFGDYVLKTSPGYKLPKHRNVNAINKYKALLEARLKIFEMKTHFNEKVLRLRKRKQEMMEKHSAERVILESFSKELPEDLVKSPPDAIKINEELEYPENRFTITERDIESILPGKFQKTGGIEESPLRDVDVEYEILVNVTKKPCNVEVRGITEMQLAADDSMETPWEAEMREMRTFRKYKEQNRIIDRMLEEISHFDEEVLKLSEEKIDLEVNAKYLELHLLVLHREILILKVFEKDEQKKSQISFDLLAQQRDLQLAMNDITTIMEEKNIEIQGHEEEMKTLVITFLESITESKYYEFLKNIFKKRYKPPKKLSDENEDSSSESSSDSDEQEDDKSLDSKDLLLKLNENICPEGCDVNDYERTFQTRAERHALELKIAEKRKGVDLLKKKFDALTKQKFKVESDYTMAEEDFEKLQREKQLRLNEIEMVVVLRLSQIQNFKSEEEVEALDDSLLLSGQLMTQLYNRVGELSRETAQQKEKHEQNKQHLTRMTLDIRHMTSVITDLENQIQHSMFRKFGTKVDLDELEQTLVKKLIAEMNFIPFEIQQKLEKKLKVTQEKLRERVNAYAVRMSENTKRYNILSILKDESSKLEDALAKQEAKKCLPLHVTDATADVDKLAETIRKQENDIARLKEEIFCLKSKNRPHSSGAFGLREMSQMALIRGPDGEYQEISLTVRNRLSNMLRETQELLTEVERIEDGESRNRLKKVVEEFMEEIPERALRAVWEQLSQGRCLENLDDMLQNREILLKAADMVVQMIGTIVPSVCDTDNGENLVTDRGDNI